MLRSIFAILTLSFFLSTSAIAETYKWKIVGANPYEGSMEWALQRSGFSHQTNQMLRKEILNGNYVNGKVCGGEILKFTTFGKKGIRYNVLADWNKEVCYNTMEYSVINGSHAYTFIYIWKCGNWSGKMVEIQEDIKPRPIIKTQKNTFIFFPYDGNDSTPDIPDDDTTVTSTNIPNTNAVGNPGNDNATGSAGESPNGSNFGDGSKGKGDVNGGNGKGNAGGKGKNK